MIKIIKKNNNLIEDFSPLDIADQKKQKEINRKVVHVLRVAKEAREAAKKARSQGKEDLAAELEDQAQQLEDWAEDKYDASVEPSDKDTVQGPSNAASGSSNNSDNTNADAENNDENKLDTPDKEESEDNSEDDFEDDSKGSDGENDSADEDESDRRSSNTNSEDDSDDDISDKNNKSSKNSNDNSDDEDSEEDDFDDDSDDEDNESSDTSVENPFDIDPKSAEGSRKTSNNSNNSDQPDELERMKSILKMLRGGEKAGAKDALAKILADRKASTEKTESLQEKLIITKAIEDIDDDSFNDIINQVLDTIDSITPIQYEEPRQVRIDQIKDTVLNTQTIRDLNQEDKTNLNKDIDPAVKEREREAQKYRVTNLPSTDTFKLDLYDAIRDQVDKIKKAKDSWGALNRRYQGTDILKPGSVIQGEWSEKKPLIQVYLDCSGSFDKDDIDKERALLNVLAEFEAQDEIATQIYYFANHLHSDYYSARNEGGTSAWGEIMNQIKATNATNVLIVTDSDMEYQVPTYGYYEVDGCVWYIWKQTRASSMSTHLTGKQAVKEYQISW